MNYRIEYANQDWDGADIDATSPIEAAKLYLRQDTDKRWQDYAEVVVCWGRFGKQRQSFPLRDLLQTSGTASGGSATANTPPSIRRNAQLGDTGHRQVSTQMDETQSAPPPLPHNPSASIRAHLTVENAVGQDYEHFSEVCDHFKAKVSEYLSKEGIGSEWLPSPDSCHLRVSVVGVDPGNATVRFFVGLLPVVGHLCGPAGTFEADAEVSFLGQSRKLEVCGSDQSSSFGTKWVLNVAAGKAALRLANAIKPLVKTVGKPYAAI